MSGGCCIKYKQRVGWWVHDNANNGNGVDKGSGGSEGEGEGGEG